MTDTGVSPGIESAGGRNLAESVGMETISPGWSESDESLGFNVADRGEVGRPIAWDDDDGDMFAATEAAMPAGLTVIVFADVAGDRDGSCSAFNLSASLSTSLHSIRSDGSGFSIAITNPRRSCEYGNLSDMGG